MYNKNKLRVIFWIITISSMLLCASCEQEFTSVDAERLFSHAEKLVIDIGPRPNGSAGNLEARDYILGKFIEYGLTKCEFNYWEHTSSSGSIIRKGYNVVGTLTGTEYPEKLFIVGGHLDTIRDGVGSADNATGIASILEIANYFSQNPPAYTIRFVAFDAEEVGLVGSRYYRESYPEDIENTVAMINLDMVQTNETSVNRPLVTYVLSRNPALRRSFRQAKYSEAPASNRMLPVGDKLAKAVSDGRLYTDIDHWKDEPVLLVWPWAVGENYHDVPGSIDEIDINALATCTSVILKTIVNLQEYSPVELAVVDQTLEDDPTMVSILEEIGGVKVDQ